MEDLTRLFDIVTQTLRACDRLVGVRDDPIAPPAYFVAQWAEAMESPAPDGALHHHPPRCSIRIRDRPRVLDDEAALRNSNLECRVVQVERPPPLTAGLDSLVEAPIQPNEVASRPKREPVQVDAHPLVMLSLLDSSR
jgi:hypothetical protein